MAMTESRDFNESNEKSPEEILELIEIYFKLYNLDFSRYDPKCAEIVKSQYDKVNTSRILELLPPQVYSLEVITGCKVTREENTMDYKQTEHWNQDDLMEYMLDTYERVVLEENAEVC